MGEQQILPGDAGGRRAAGFVHCPTCSGWALLPPRWEPIPDFVGDGKQLVRDPCPDCVAAGRKPTRPEVRCQAYGGELCGREAVRVGLVRDRLVVSCAEHLTYADPWTGRTPPPLPSVLPARLLKEWLKTEKREQRDLRKAIAALETRLRASEGRMKEAAARLAGAALPGEASGKLRRLDVPEREPQQPTPRSLFDVGGTGEEEQV